MTPKRLAGFTVVEIIVVVMSLAVVSAGMVFLSFLANAQSRDAQRLSHLRQLQAGLERYYHDHDRYPDGESLALGASGARCLDEDGFGDSCDPDGRTYLAAVPLDPSGGGYAYSASQGLTFQIAFRLERSLGDLAAGPHAASPEGIR